MRRVVAQLVETVKAVAKDRRAMTATDVMLLIFIGVTIAIGALVVGFIQGAIAGIPGLPSHVQSLLNTTFGYVFTGLNLATIGIIVLAAVLILGVLMVFFVRGGGRGRR